MEGEEWMFIVVDGWRWCGVDVYVIRLPWNSS